MELSIDISEEALNPEAGRRFVSKPDAGAQVVFVGAVRDHTGDREVNHLFYESYKPMAIKEMRKIAQAANEAWPTKAIWVHHRVGTLHISDIAVVIAVSSAHRQAAFSACQYIIDTLKKEVPIWKKECFSNGEEWISPRP